MGPAVQELNRFFTVPAHQDLPAIITMLQGS